MSESTVKVVEFLYEFDECASPVQFIVGPTIQHLSDEEIYVLAADAIKKGRAVCDKWEDRVKPFKEAGFVLPTVIHSNYRLPYWDEKQKSNRIAEHDLLGIG